MASLIPGYEYDIFISYRQKDNKYDGWVTEFVDNLKRELEATFKEDISVYFDINPHDGLLETHDVDASLKEKLKCLVFVPIISRTYCDPKSFAWEHEFKAFVESASNDQFGLKVKLPNGNVASRVLPVRIHDLDTADIRLCETVLGGVLRGVEFIYKEPGVNRSLTPKDKEKKNLNGTIYRNQINKVALAIKEIILGMQAGPGPFVKEKAQKSELFGEDVKVKKFKGKKKTAQLNKRRLQIGIVITALLIITAILVWPMIFRQEASEKLTSSGKKVAIAVMPFQNLTNDTTWNVWKVGIEMDLINSLSNTGELIVRPRDAIKNLLQANGLTEYASISSEIAGTISKNLDADIYIFGGIQKSGSLIRVNAQLIDTKTKEVLKSFEINWPYNEKKIFDLTDSLRKKVTDFLILSKLIKENSPFISSAQTTTSPEAFRYYLYGSRAFVKFDAQSAINWWLKSLAADSNYFEPMIELSSAYSLLGMEEQNLYWVVKYYNKREQWPLSDRLAASWAYACNFESPAEQIKYLKQIQEIDGLPSYILGLTYLLHTKQYDKAITELEKVLEMDRKWGLLKNQPAYIQLCKAYYYAGQYKKEKKLFKEVERVNDDHESGYFLSIIFLQTVLSLTEKDSVASKRYIEKYISIEKGLSLSEADYTADFGWMYSMAGHKDRAEGFYRKALSLEPENPVYLKKLADFFIDNTRKLNEVAELMDKAMKLAKNRIDYYNYMDTKGWAFYKMGKNNDALEILQKTWDEAPYKIYTIRSHYEEVKKAVEGQK